MKNYLPVLLFPLFITLFSCNNSATKDETPEEKRDSSSPTVTAPTDSSKAFGDSITKLIVDDYPVTNKMLDCNGPDGTCELRYNSLLSLDKIWFSNNTLKQTLVFELYTDYHRLITFHFSNTDIPAGLIKRMLLATPDREEASDKQKMQNFSGLLPLAQKISSEYFTSVKGFKIGDPKEKATQVYGKPDITKAADGVEEYEWDFTGDILYDGKTDLKGKPLAKDNYGHQVIMFFRDNKLIGMVLHNDIP